MKQKFMLLAALLLCSGFVHAALRYGLGNAVAHRSADLVNKAGNASNVTGDNVAATLPSCSSGALFDSLPVDMTEIGGIDPLGHVQPTGHTFPADHIYYYSSTTTVYTPAVYAPGTIHVTGVASSTNLSAIPSPYTDYTVTFYACREFRGVYGHVKTLNPALLSQAGAMSSCQTYTTGGNMFQLCTANTNFVMQSGDLIGNLASSGSLDFSGSDDRVLLSYVSPARRGPNQLHTICPVDYFTSGPKAIMQAKLGRFDGGHMRTTPPICGTIEQDIANTAKGYWYHPGSPDNPEDPHLSLIDNNVYAPQQTISVGNSLPNVGGMWVIFTPGSSGMVDRDLSQVTADGNTYCYDTFFDPLGQPAFTGYSFILKMPTATTLTFEKLAVASCGPGPWTFGSNAVTFQR